MEIFINGKPHQANDTLTAAQLVEHLGLNGKRLAMEVNEEIVPRSHYENYQFKANDRIEIVHAIGGG